MLTSFDVCSGSDGEYSPQTRSNFYADTLKSLESGVLKEWLWRTFDLSFPLTTLYGNCFLPLPRGECLRGSARSYFSHLNLSSHEAIIEMETEFFHKNFTEKDPKSLMDHIQSVASGEASFFPNVLSLVYDKLFEKSLPKNTPFNPGPGQVFGSHGATTSLF